MFNLNISIILLPFMLVIFSSLIFLFLRIFVKKKYFLNLLISLIFSFFLVLFFIYKTNDLLNEHQIFYLIFSYLFSSFIFMNLIQASVSSLQLAILRIVYKKPGITKKQIIKKYNSNRVFEERIKRLESGGVISRTKSSYYLKNKKILVVLNFFLILKNIFNVKIY
jgi:hypothetical protein